MTIQKMGENQSKLSLRPLRSGSFYFPRIGSLNPSIVKKNKREAQRSFRATRSKLVLRYNLAGSDISL